jgi:hypothetical protein
VTSAHDSPATAISAQAWDRWERAREHGIMLDATRKQVMNQSTYPMVNTDSTPVDTDGMEDLLARHKNVLY